MRQLHPRITRALSRWSGYELPSAGLLAVLVLGLLLSWAGASVAGDGSLLSGEALYNRNCAACHGLDGTGAPSSIVGFKTPLPDFTDCNFATREADADWLIVAEKGGPARGFSEEMPAFGEALTQSELQRAIDHIRTFCNNPDWPRGELNLPRPLVTTKAYPEDEFVLAVEMNTEGLNRIGSELIFEKRIGARNQVELVLPVGWSEQAVAENGETEWTSGVGDIALGFKRVMFHSLETGSIFTLGGELLLPTGDEDEGFGSNTTVFEPYLLYGQIFPADFFLHLQAGAGLPFDTDRKNEEAFWRAAAGRAFYTGEFGRRWSPMVELVGSRELVSGADTNWELVPQFQVTLSRRQHVRLAAGASFPLNDTDVREPVYMAYLLWDWFDGGFFDGW